MKHSAPWGFLSPSSSLLKFVDELVVPGKSVTLDLACGFGRNAIVMAAYGSDVICADRDCARLRHLDATKSALLKQAPVNRGAGRLMTVCANFSSSVWPFTANSFDLITSVHFF
jgi:SAM-dependent methyltransferase